MSRMRVRFLALSALLVVLLPVLAACGGSSSTGGGTSAKKIKVGLVTDIGGLNDRGFNASAYAGLQKAKNELGIQGEVKESKSGNDYVPFLTQFATQGYDLVVGVGFLMQEAVGTVSGQFPKVKFALVDGVGTDAAGKDLHHANVQSLLFHEQDAGALVGVAAGLLEKDGATPKHTNSIGAVGGLSIPPVDKYIAGYVWGARLENPSIKITINYSNDFADPTKCKDKANTLIGPPANAEIIFQVAGGCGLGALQAAGDKGVYSIGVDTDQKSSNASVIASALKKVDVATFTSIKSVVDNLFVGGPLAFTMQNDGVGFAPGNVSLPADVTAEVQKIADQIKSGAVEVPTDIPPELLPQ